MKTTWIGFVLIFSYWISTQCYFIHCFNSTEVETASSRGVISSTQEPSCEISVSELLGPTPVCKKQIIFEGGFSSGTLDGLKWKRAHFIPSEPDYEFCSYQRRSDTIYIQDGKLVLKPIAHTLPAEVRGTLDLRNGCTAHLESNCIMYQESGFILPPVTSAKMKTNKAFKYGTFEVRAKLPIGDWLYPEIYLQSAPSLAKQIWIAYARGNEHLTGGAGDDIGGSFLFGGPVLNTSEPDRSKYLSSTKSNISYGSEYHTYSVIWEPSKLSLFIDGKMYGRIENSILSLFNEPMYLILGVGVGGITDFPDFYVSGNNKSKPWINMERLQVKKFFNARNDWLPTWSEDGSALMVEHVKIWAL